MKIYTGFEIEIEAIDQSTNYEHYTLAKNEILNLANKTVRITNTNLQNIENYHFNRTDFNSTAWRLEEDGSLVNGAEFISPPEPIDISIKKLFNFLDYIDDSKCTTSDKCGLHVNMSADNKTLDGIDIPTFVTLINQRLLFKLWGQRMKDYHYVRNMQKIFRLRQHYILSTYNSRDSIDTRIKSVSDIILENRYNFVNIRTANGKKYIEIRVIGGKNYHKKKEEIKQTVEHFEKILKQAKTPQPLHKKTCQKIISYVNRISHSDNEDIFIPNRYTNLLLPEEAFANKIKQLENIHKYCVNSFLRKLGKCWYVSTNKHASIRKYFDECINFMLGNVIVSSFKKRCDYIDYINYHYIKFIYNNFNRKQCSRCLLDYKLERFYGLCLPNDEPKRNILWMLKLMRTLPMRDRKRFVNKLPMQLVNYISNKKIPGFIMLAKSKKKS